MGWLVASLGKRMGKEGRRFGNHTRAGMGERTQRDTAPPWAPAFAGVTNSLTKRVRLGEGFTPISIFPRQGEEVRGEGGWIHACGDLCITY